MTPDLCKESVRPLSSPFVSTSLLFIPEGVRPRRSTDGRETPSGVQSDHRPPNGFTL